MCRVEAHLASSTIRESSELDKADLLQVNIQFTIQLLALEGVMASGISINSV